MGNIILALTKYGRTDPWDVQKIPPYNNEIISYFENRTIGYNSNYTKLKAFKIDEKES